MGKDLNFEMKMTIGTMGRFGMRIWAMAVAVILRPESSKVANLTAVESFREEGEEAAGILSLKVVFGILDMLIKKNTFIFKRGWAH